MTTAAIALPRVQRPVLALALAAAAGLVVYLTGIDARHAVLFVVGMGLGVSLYHAAFGFTGAYRRAIVERDISGVTAQLVMLAAAMLLFAPILAQGQAFGRGIGGALAPASLSVAVGAFLFGIGMQVAGGCASGTLYTAGGTNVRMILVLAFFVAGSFWGSLDLDWWSRLPGIGVVSLGRELGWGTAIGLQLGALALIYAGLRLAGARHARPLWFDGGFSRRRLLQGPWPLLLSAGLLALLNWATLLIAGHPWTITWAFSLWGAKTALALGWDPATSPFWTGPFQQAALARPILADVTSVMNIGIMLGALVAASLAGKVAPKSRIPLPSLVAAVVGGLLLGYGARLAYGCNIGSFFSGVASTSLHGWLWLLCAVPGNMIGVRLRPLFRLDG
ncbi:MAG: YeeE/YedE family protein [Rhodospirillales bacterium]